MVFSLKVLTKALNSNKRRFLVFLQLPKQYSSINPSQPHPTAAVQKKSDCISQDQSPPIRAMLAAATLTTPHKALACSGHQSVNLVQPSFNSQILFSGHTFLTTWRHTGKTGRAQRARAHRETQSNWGDLKPGGDSALDTFISVALEMHLLDKDSTSQRVLSNRMAHSTLFRLAGLSRTLQMVSLSAGTQVWPKLVPQWCTAKSTQPNRIKQASRTGQPFLRKKVFIFLG